MEVGISNDFQASVGTGIGTGVETGVRIGPEVMYTYN